MDPTLFVFNPHHPALFPLPTLPVSRTTAGPPVRFSACPHGAGLAAVQGAAAGRVPPAPMGAVANRISAGWARIGSPPTANVAAAGQVAGGHMGAAAGGSSLTPMGAAAGRPPPAPWVRNQADLRRPHGRGDRAPAAAASWSWCEGLT